MRSRDSIVLFISGFVLSSHQEASYIHIPHRRRRAQRNDQSGKAINILKHTKSN